MAGSTAPQHWTSLGYLRPIFDYVQQHGGDQAELLRLAGLTEAELHNADLRVDNALFNPLLARAAQMLDDDNIGVHAGQAMRVQHVGILGMLVMNCHLAREVFELQARYQTLVGNGLTTDYRVVGDELCMHVVVPEGQAAFERHAYEFNLAGWFHLKNQIVGPQHKPLRVELPYAQPADDSEQRELFGAPLSYGHDAIRVYFDLGYRELELMAADPQLKQVLEAQAKKRLAELQGEQADQDPDLAQVKQYIAEKLAYGAPALEDVAEQMQVSVRTLQRRLDSRETSYKQLLDQVRCDLAGRYIENAELSLLDVAMMLGFAEQSSFARAFKRWFGDAPGAYRRQVLGV